MAYEKKPFVDFVKFNHQRDEKDIIDEYNSYRDKYSECKHCKVCQERNYFKYNRKKDKIRFKYCNGVKDLIDDNKWTIVEGSNFKHVKTTDGHTLASTYLQDNTKRVHYFNYNNFDFRLKNIYVSKDKILKPINRYKKTKDEIYFDEIDMVYVVFIPQKEHGNIRHKFATEREAFVFYCRHYRSCQLSNCNHDIFDLRKIQQYKADGFTATEIASKIGVSRQKLYTLLRDSCTCFDKL